MLGPALGSLLELDDVRAEIDRVDARLAPLLEERADLVARAARAKAGAGIPAADYVREGAVLLRFAEGLPREMAAGVVRAAREWQVRASQPAEPRRRPPPDSRADLWAGAALIAALALLFLLALRVAAP